MSPDYLPSYGPSAWHSRQNSETPSEAKREEQVLEGCRTRVCSLEPEQGATASRWIPHAPLLPEVRGPIALPRSSRNVSNGAGRGRQPLQSSHSVGEVGGPVRGGGCLLTLRAESRSAPLSSITRTTSLWPIWDAIHSGAVPSCGKRGGQCD